MDATIEDQLRKEREQQEAGQHVEKNGRPSRDTTEGHRDTRLQRSVTSPISSTLPPPPRYGSPMTSAGYKESPAILQDIPHEGPYPNLLTELQQKTTPRQ